MIIEVEASIGAMLQKKLQDNDCAQHFSYIFSKVKEAFLSSVDYVSYGLTDVVHLDDFDAELCESFLLNRDLKTKVKLLDIIEEFFEVSITTGWCYFHAHAEQAFYCRNMKPLLSVRYARIHLNHASMASSSHLIYLHPK